MTRASRLRELDFLRGLAIILVLFRHQTPFRPLMNMAWIGVDLFFVLSGFLVSSILFNEYSRHGNINPTRFLIRRGFKIYPVYYLFYLPYLVPLVLNDSVNYLSLFGDMVFLQNYVTGWGYAYAASWSVAVEEHFYFSLAVIFWLILRKDNFASEKETQTSPETHKMAYGIAFSLALCLIIRIASNMIWPDQHVRNTTMTHLRLDSLLAGVLLAYLFHFRKDCLLRFFHTFKYLLLTAAFACLAWTPFVDPIPSFFVRTIGFTLVYSAFGILLLSFLSDPGINRKLDSVLGKPLVDMISKIGLYSYSIYIIHSWVYRDGLQFLRNHVKIHPYGQFLITFAASIVLGMLITHLVENYFLKLRDRYFPARY